MIELTRIDRWLYQRLTGSQLLAGLGIYNTVAPPEASMPFVLFAFQSAEADVMTIGARRLVVNPLYQIKVIGTGLSLAPLEPYADAIDAALQAQSGAALDGYVLACIREQPLVLMEEDAGTIYRHLGGLYRIRFLPQ